MPLVRYAPELFEVAFSKVIFVYVKVTCYSLQMFVFDQMFWHINRNSQIDVKQIKLAAFTVTRSDKIFFGGHQLQFGTEIHSFGYLLFMWVMT